MTNPNNEEILKILESSNYMDKVCSICKFIEFFTNKKLVIHDYTDAHLNKHIDRTITIEFQEKE
jgi:predicted nucleic-acid-binding Zn-ribbon protein